MTEFYQEIKNRIDDVIYVLNKVEYSNIVKTTYEFNVSKQRLRRRFKNVQNKIQCKNKNRRLNEN